MAIDWDKLRVFYFVAKAKSFNRAASDLNISQSALSRSVQLLEHLIGVQLFIRVPKGVILTKQGEILFEKVQEMQMAFEDAKSAIEDESSEPQGLLKIATTVALASSWIVEFVPDFLEKYPNIELDIIGHDEYLNVKARQADASIRPLPTDTTDLVHDYLFSCFLSLYASPEYLEAHGEPEAAEDLDNHKIITFGESTIRPYSNVDWPLRVGKKNNQVRNPFIRINSAKGASRLAEKGMGIVALSKEFPGIADMNLVSILQDVKGPIIDLYYVYPEALKASKRVTVFGDFIKSCIPKDSKNPFIAEKEKILLKV